MPSQTGRPGPAARFFIEIPDKDGNLAMKPAVVQGRIVQGGTPAASAAHCGNPARKVILFDGPPEFTARYGQAAYADYCPGWAEVKGPARMLAREEHDAIVRGGIGPREP